MHTLVYWTIDVEQAILASCGVSRLNDILMWLLEHAYYT